MEILKKSVLVAIIAIFMNNHVQAQTQAQLQEAFVKSYTLESEKKYQEAANALSNIYSEQNYEVNLRLGWLHYLIGNKEKSVGYYNKCIKLMPLASEPLWGIIYPYSAKEDWVNVEKTYLSILKLDPKNASAHYRLGLIYYYRKNYTAAKKYFDVSLNLNPFDYDSLLMSAWNNYFLGNMSNAKVLFNKVLLNRPNDASAMEGLSLIK
ncbi:MAG: tetratricopeptide repeat protein [Thermonemataceae bacterium]|nr:tetratricopeptide repeat protein [Thermonemataceae bacterium]